MVIFSVINFWKYEKSRHQFYKMFVYATKQTSKPDLGNNSLNLTKNDHRMTLQIFFIHIKLIY